MIRRLLVLGVLLSLEPVGALRADDRPNILWITCEDISPNLGCYGDSYAVTPNLDRLAKQSVRYTEAFAVIGVCAPARSSIITGMYACSIGTSYMRCQGTVPAQMKEFPRYLRDAGYFCTNHTKTDYNFAFSKETWDQNGAKAHWRNRKPGQPFFSVINFTSCHESQIRLPEAQYRKRVADFTSKEIHDPAKAPLPPYHPDTPGTRKNWARYADMITYMDKEVGGVLKQLEDDGLADDTIVFFYSDHGAGMPRSKRWLYDSSTRVPFMVRLPEKYAAMAPSKPGSTTDRLISFVDLAPTALSLAGIGAPEMMQGVAFLGSKAGEPRKYVYGFRDRMDERYDMLRSVYDGRYRYIRNYRPELPWFHHQYIGYMYEMDTMKDWERLSDEGNLHGPTALFMADIKPTEELYDVQADPWEVRNLADSAEHRETLEKLRAEHQRWRTEILDLGFLPESDLRTRFGDEAPYDAVRRDPSLYPFDRIASTADLAGQRKTANLDKLAKRAGDDDPAVRWWALEGFAMLGADAKPAAETIEAALDDSKPGVRVAAADALARIGRPAEATRVLIQVLTQSPNEWARLAAINVLDRLDSQAAEARSAIEQAQNDRNDYVKRVVEHALETIDRKK
ncbi:MAG TPA: sulfatase-like hydrolase/transferase [Isosphaeraceae bacterium]|nr:sulfatase-like hydrolase/transferase [Isosphaeraceae bacterium]